MEIFIVMATEERRILLSIATPCSVNAYGAYLSVLFLAIISIITICDDEDFAWKLIMLYSLGSSWNYYSSAFVTRMHELCVCNAWNKAIAFGQILFVTNEQLERPRYKQGREWKSFRCVFNAYSFCYFLLDQKVTQKSRRHQGMRCG